MGEVKRRGRYNVLVTISTGETRTIAEWSSKTGIDPEIIRTMLKEGRATDVAVGNSVHSIKRCLGRQ